MLCEIIWDNASDFFPILKNIRVDNVTYIFQYIVCICLFI